MWRPLVPGETKPLPREFVDKYLGGGAEFVRYGVPGDGSCLFHSVCAALNYNNYLTQPVQEQAKIGHRFRCDFQKHITPDEWNSFVRREGLSAGGEGEGDVPSVDVVKRDFCNKKFWATEPMIRYVANKMNMNMIFMDVDGKQLYCGVHGKNPESQPTTLVLWLNRAHFEPMARVDFTPTSAPRKTWVFDPRRDSKLVSQLMTTYSRECKI